MISLQSSTSLKGYIFQFHTYFVDDAFQQADIVQPGSMTAYFTLLLICSSQACPLSIPKESRERLWYGFFLRILT